MICPDCGKEISDSSKFCRFCGIKTDIGIYCEKCGRRLENDSLFCSECGTPVQNTGIAGNMFNVDGLILEEDYRGNIFISRYISRYKGKSSTVNIPAVINGKCVTEIASGAFYENALITDVVIPDGIKRIGSRVFRGCTALRSINLPRGITEIGSELFYGCSELTAVNIPAGVTDINEYAFYGCQALKSVTIPSGVIGIGNNAFRDCSSLTEMSLPDSVTMIGSRAFEGCKSLTITYKGKTYKYCDQGDGKRYCTFSFRKLYDVINNI